jgi:flagellar biogenesis protein FliO
MGSTAAYALETLVTLLGILLLAAIVLFGARRLGVGRATGPLELLGRLPLDGRKSIYLARVGNKVYALLASEAGLSKLDELDPETLPSHDVDKTPFGQLIAKALNRKGQDSHEH